MSDWVVLDHKQIDNIFNTVPLQTKDKKIGTFSHHKLSINGSSVNLNKIKAFKTETAGFFASTKVKLKTVKGNIDQTYNNLFAQLVNSQGKQLQVKDLLKTIKTIDASYKDMKKLTTGSKAEVAQKLENDALKNEATRITNLSNRELSDLYQTLTSSEMEFIRDCLSKEQNDDTKYAANLLFDIEGMVIKEISTRYIDGRVTENTNIDSVAKQFDVDDAAIKKSTYKSKNDISTTSMALLAESATGAYNALDKNYRKLNNDLKARNLDKITMKTLGDNLRSKDITINMPTKYLFEGDFSIFGHPNDPIANIFRLKDNGLNPKGDGYLGYREEVENKNFSILDDHKVVSSERPVYGALNVQNSKFGGAFPYGKAVIVLNDDVKKRSTFTLGDTFKTLKLKGDAKSRETFFKLIEDSNLTLKFKQALKDENSEGFKALNKLLNYIEKDPEANIGVLQPISDSFSKLSQLFETDPENGDHNMNTFLKLISQCFGDSEATQNESATYDNMENLFASMTLYDKNQLAKAQVDKLEGKDTTPRLKSIDYIEAQIHGDIIPSRDIKEIRVYIAKNEDTGNKYTQEEITEMMIAANNFRRNTGVKITFIEDDKGLGIEENHEEIRAFNYAHLNKNKVNQVLDDLKKPNGIAKLYNETYNCNYCTSVERNLKAQILSKTEENIQSMIQAGANAEGFSTEEGLVSQAANYAMNTVLDPIKRPVVTMCRRLGLDDAAKEFLLQETLRTGKAPTEQEAKKIASHMLADTFCEKENLEKQVADYIKANPELLSNLPKGMELHLNGAILGVLARNIGLDLVDVIKGNPTLHPNDILQTAFENNTKKIIGKKIQLLQGLRELNLSPKQEKVFIKWIQSAGKINDVEELNLIAKFSLENLQLFKDIIKSEPPLSGNAIFVKYVDFFNKCGPTFEDYGNRHEFGFDEVSTELDRVAFLAKDLLLSDDEFSKEDLGKLQQSLNQNEITGHLEVINTLLDNKDNKISPQEWKKLYYFDRLMTNTDTVLEKELENNGRGQAKPIEYGIKFVSKDTREFISKLGCQSAVEILNAAAPLQSVPAPLHPEKMPKTFEDNRNFCIKTLSKYHENEEKFDLGGVHGRGHISRAFIGANVMCNILEEKYHLKVDKNLVLMGISGHDAGREQNGEEVAGSEERSADFTLKVAKSVYGDDAMGEDYENYLKGSIIHYHEKSNTLEGMILRSADSLDILRVRGTADYDKNKLEFLNNQNMTDDVINIREQLISEMHLLEMFTDPSGAKKDTRDQLTIQMIMTQNPLERDQLNNAVKKMDQDAFDEYAELRKLTDEDFFAHVENVIKEHKTMFPLFSKYYH